MLKTSYGFGTPSCSYGDKVREEKRGLLFLFDVTQTSDYKIWFTGYLTRGFSVIWLTIQNLSSRYHHLIYERWTVHFSCLSYCTFILDAKSQETGRGLDAQCGISYVFGVFLVVSVWAWWVHWVVFKRNYILLHSSAGGFYFYFFVCYNWALRLAMAFM